MKRSVATASRHFPVGTRQCGLAVHTPGRFHTALLTHLAASPILSDSRSPDGVQTYELIA